MMERRKLARREREILTLLCSGLEPKEIADELEISRGTVYKRIYGMYLKLGVRGRVGLVLWALNSPDVSRVHPSGCMCDSPLCVALRRSAA